MNQGLAVKIEGEYDPEEYADLEVDNDIKQLFHNITAF